MAINVDVRIGRLIPNTNEASTVLVLVDKDMFKEEDANPIKLTSVSELDNFKQSIGTEEDGSDFKPILLQLEYLLRAGMQVIVSGVGTILNDDEVEVVGLTEDEIEELSDTLLFNYRFIYDPTNSITNVKTLLDKVDAEWFISVNGEEDNTAWVGPKVSVFDNSGVASIPTTFQTELEEEGIPSALAVLVRKAKVITEGLSWTPIAGELNGRITEFIRNIRLVGTVEKQELIEAKINPMVLKPGVGSIISSQLTRETDPTSPLINGHIVTLTLELKRSLINILEHFKHQLNNSKTWSLIKLRATSLLLPIQENENPGIESFNVRVGLGETMTEEDVREGKLKLAVDFIPINAIKEINLVLTINESSDGFIIETEGGL